MRGMSGRTAVDSESEDQGVLGSLGVFDIKRSRVVGLANEIRSQGRPSVSEQGKVRNRCESFDVKLLYCIVLDPDLVLLAC